MNFDDLLEEMRIGKNIIKTLRTVIRENEIDDHMTEQMRNAILTPYKES